jgi:heme exporter protein A
MSCIGATQRGPQGRPRVGLGRRRALSPRLESVSAHVQSQNKPEALPDSAGRASGAVPVLAATGLECWRGERRLFHGLHFALHAGQVVWLRGANGRGKTSLLRVLAGLSAPEAGALFWRSQPWRDVREEAQRGTLYLAHANALHDDLTAHEALVFLARLHGQAESGASDAGFPAAVDRALADFGLNHKRHAAVRTLSQGQRRRVALARLRLEPRKPLWLLDEPYDALDADGCALLDGVLAAHAAAGGAVLLASHLPLALRSPLPLELVLSGPA